MGRMTAQMKSAIDRATSQEAHLLRREIVIGLRDQAPGGQPILPLSETTILLRGLPQSSRGGRAAMGRNVHGPLAKGQRRVRKARRSKGRRNLGYNEYGPRAKRQKRSRAPRRKTARRGPSKALIRRGDLIGGINVKRLTFGHYTVGVHRGERGRRGGSDLVNIAEIHEYGTKSYTMTVTDKMVKFSKFLYIMGILEVPWKKGQTLRKKIDARPFLRPSRDVWEMNAEDRFGVRFQFMMTGKV